MSWEIDDCGSWGIATTDNPAGDMAAGLALPGSWPMGEQPTIWVRDDQYENLLAGGGGSTEEDDLIIRKFPVAYNSAGLSSPSGSIPGHVVYTPTVGDVVYDVWLHVDTAWDGTTPSADIGPLDISAGGWTKLNLFDHLYVNLADHDDGTGSTLNDMRSILELVNTQIILAPADGSLTANPLSWGARTLPWVVKETTPILMVVSTDGTGAGDNPGATQGAATVYVVTGTPV